MSVRQVGGRVKRVGKSCRDCKERFPMEKAACPKCGSRRYRWVTTLA